MSILKDTWEVCAGFVLIFTASVLSWIGINFAALYLKASIVQTVLGTAIMLALFVGLYLLVDHVRTHNRLVMERAKRGLYERPDSFTAIDEEFAQRRRDQVRNMASRRYTQRPEVPPTAPPRGPRV